MTRSSAILLITVFIAVVVFGFIAMNHGMSQHQDCAAAQAQGVICPQALGAAAFAQVHSRFLQNLTWATLLAAVIAAFVGMVFDLSHHTVRPVFAYPLAGTAEPQHHGQALRSWLSLLEVSPNTL